MRVGRPWHRVPRAAVAAPGSLAVSQARVDGAWSSLGQWKVTLPWQEVALGAFKVLHSYRVSHQVWSSFIIVENILLFAFLSAG